MKKKNLKSLKLNKQSISHINQDLIVGAKGTNPTRITVIPCLSINFCLTDTCISTVYDGPVNETCFNC